MKNNNSENKLNDNTLSTSTEYEEKKSVNNTISTIDENDKDLPWYFLIFSILVGLPAGIANTNKFLSEHFITISNIPIKALPQILAYTTGGTIVPFLISLIVIGFIWIIRVDKKPIKHIFIMSIILSVISFIAVNQY